MNESMTIKALAIACFAVLSMGASHAATDAAIKADYTLAIEQCASLAGNPKDVCKAEAKAVEEKSEAKRQADSKPSAKASRHMQEEYAEADYSVALTKCGALTGNDKDVCKKEAKAVKVTAMQNSKTNKEVTDRLSDSADAKNTAAYAVAKEKCGAFSGAVKDKCAADAKLSYGK